LSSDLLHDCYSLVVTAACCISTAIAFIIAITLAANVGHGRFNEEAYCRVNPTPRPTPSPTTTTKEKITPQNNPRFSPQILPLFVPVGDIPVLAVLLSIMESTGSGTGKKGPNAEI
jgi:hypothetical protein